MTKTYDSRCYDLAKVFLDNEPEAWTDGHAQALAALIQQTIEDFIADMRMED